MWGHGTTGVRYRGSVAVWKTVPKYSFSWWGGCWTARNCFVTRRKGDKRKGEQTPLKRNESVKRVWINRHANKREKWLFSVRKMTGQLNYTPELCVLQQKDETKVHETRKTKEKACGGSTAEQNSLLHRKATQIHRITSVHGYLMESVRFSVSAPYINYPPAGRKLRRIRKPHWNMPIYGNVRCRALSGAVKKTLRIAPDSEKTKLVAHGVFKTTKTV